QLTDDTADRRMIAAKVARVELRRGVPFLLELHVADDGELVRDLRVQRQQLADVDAGHVRPRRRELATVLDGRVRLEVVHVHVAWPTVQVDHDDGLVVACRRGLRPQTQKVGQGESSGSQGTGPEKFTTRDRLKHGSDSVTAPDGSTPAERPSTRNS